MQPLAKKETKDVCIKASETVQLPADVWALIGSFLTVREHQRCIASKFLKAVLLRDASWSPRLILNHACCFVWANGSKKITNPQVRELSLQSPEFGHPVGVDIPALAGSHEMDAFYAAMPNLRKLEVLSRVPCSYSYHTMTPFLLDSTRSGAIQARPVIARLAELALRAQTISELNAMEMNLVDAKQMAMFKGHKLVLEYVVAWDNFNFKAESQPCWHLIGETVKQLEVAGFWVSWTKSRIPLHVQELKWTFPDRNLPQTPLRTDVLREQAYYKAAELRSLQLVKAEFYLAGAWFLRVLADAPKLEHIEIDCWVQSPPKISESERIHEFLADKSRFPQLKRFTIAADVVPGGGVPRSANAMDTADYFRDLCNLVLAARPNQAFAFLWSVRMDRREFARGGSA